MSLAVQVVFTGLSAGGVYGLIAIGHWLIYRLTGIVHFALGDLIGLGAFITLLVAAGTQPLTQETVSGSRMALAIIAGVVACVVVGAAGYFAVVQPYIGRSAIGWVAATRALAFGLAGGMAAIAVVVAAPGTPFETGTGALLGLKGLVAAVLVRFGGLWTVFAAGLALGVVEAALG